MSVLRAAPTLELILFVPLVGPMAANDEVYAHQYSAMQLWKKQARLAVAVGSGGHS